MELSEIPPPKLLDGIRGMAKACGLRENFLVDLLFNETNDWSFVVKAHALLESVVCQLLAAHLRQPALEDAFAQKVEMEARITMLKALDLTTEVERKMMRALGNLRNTLVHNAQQTDFTFAEHLKDKQRRQHFVDTYATSWPDPIPNTNPPVSRASYILENPRTAVWMSVIEIIGKNLDAKMKVLFEEQQSLALKALRDATAGTAPSMSQTSISHSPEGK